MAIVHEPGAEDDQRHDEPLNADEARQADGHRESIRVLDTSLVLAVLALAILGIYFAAVAVS